MGRDRGELFDPERFTAMHSWHVANGAKFEDVGQWKRPWYFPKAGETMQQSLDRECLATRESVGILDASTLAKSISKVKMHANSWPCLHQCLGQACCGRCRYGLMCGEDGMVFDDGVTACWVITTSS